MTDALHHVQASRRRILVAGIAAATAFAAQPAVSKPISSNTDFDEEFDVLVVGSGAAGLTAGITAAEAGASTVIFEKMPYTGGSTRISQCDMAIVGSPLQKKLGIDDKPEWLAADMQKVAGGLTDPKMALIIARGTAGLLEFMQKRGVVFNDGLMHFGGHSAKRCMWPVGGGKGIVNPLEKHFRGLSGTKLLTRAKVDRILLDETGRAIGLEVRENYLFDPSLQSDDNDNRSGSVRRYRARRGIVFASGGFCRDRLIVPAEAPYLEGISSNAQVGATAGAIRTLMEAGAYPMHMSLFRFSFPISYTDLCWGMYVDPTTGKRFVNEAENRDVVSLAILGVKKKNGGKTPIIFYDSDAIKNFHDTRRLKRGLAGKNTCGGNIKAFDTLEEAAAAYGIPTKEFLAQVDRYNAMLDRSDDTEFGKDMKEMEGAGLRKAPFYAMQAMPFIAYTAGGARITEKAEVISARTWKPIPGLYAAGEATGGIHGANRLTSCSVIDCGVFGMIAGREAARPKA